MHPASHSRLAPGLPSGEPTASDDALPEPRPQDAGPPVPGRTCTRTAVADSPAARHLPVLVLLRIFSHLPLCALSRCARVCRHWHDCLPAPEVRLSRWLRQHAPLSCLAAANPGQRSNHRSLSFLQAARSPLVPALMHLHQQQPPPRSQGGRMQEPAPHQPQGRSCCRHCCTTA